MTSHGGDFLKFQRGLCTGRDNFDYERLVELVREQEMLYNPTNKDYKVAQMIVFELFK